MQVEALAEHPKVVAEEKVVQGDVQTLTVEAVLGEHRLVGDGEVPDDPEEREMR